MRMGTLMGAACAALLVTSAVADAQTARKGKARKATTPDFSWVDRGGPLNCFDPNQLTAQQQAVMRRLGQEACEGMTITRTVRSAPPPTPIARAAPIVRARAVAYQADGYTVYWEKPGYCSLFLDTPRGAMVRFSYSADGATNFSYYRRGLTLDPSTPSYTALFSFDGSRDMTGYAAVDTQLDDGPAGFHARQRGR